MTYPSDLPDARTKRTWPKKFLDAGRGVLLASHGQSSFAVHGLVILLVLLAGFWLQVEPLDWGILALCIAMVLAAETFNSALERAVKVLHPNHHPEVGAALDMASGAVLIASLGAAVSGAIVFFRHLL